jgi:hypothetical protein
MRMDDRVIAVLQSIREFFALHGMDASRMTCEALVRCKAEFHSIAAARIVRRIGVPAMEPVLNATAGEEIVRR